MVLAFALAMLAAQPADTPPAAMGADPLAQARNGQLQCFEPDPARHTCKSLAGYVFAPDGAITNQAQVLVSLQGPIVMLTSTPVVVRDGKVCGPVRTEDIDQSRLMFAGRPLDGPQAVQVKAKLKARMGEMIGTEVCTRFTPDASGWVTQVTVNGELAPPQASMRGIWVRPDDGWTVAP
jgi:hypothetical protein